MDYNPANSRINIKENAPAAKTLHLKKLPFVVAVLGQIAVFLYLIVHFHFLILISVPHIWQIFLSELSDGYSWFFSPFRLTIFYQKARIVNGNYSFALKTMTRSDIHLSSGHHEKPQKLPAPFQLLPSCISLLEASPSISDIHPFLCFNANRLRILKMMKPLSDSSSQTVADHHSQ